MAKRSGGGAFFFGSVIGGAVGAVVALWKTPQSGKELRQKLGLENERVTTVTSATRNAASSASGVARTAAASATDAARTAAASASSAAKSAADTATHAVRHDTSMDSASTTSPTFTPSTTSGSSGTPAAGLASRALGLVEKAAAPLVGVKLGQTANNSQPGETRTTVAAPTGAASVSGTVPTSTAAETSPGLTPPGTVPVMPSGSK